MHTFGVGKGADANLIKLVAMAGMGHFTFILDPEEIQEKVISALTKTVFEYGIIMSADLFDENDKIVHSFPQKEAMLPNSVYSKRVMLKNSAAKYAKIKVYDPNTTQFTTYLPKIESVFSPALFTSVARHEVLKEHDMEKRTQMSINYGVLDKTTAMLALKRIQHPSGEETELVEIPMRQVNLLDRIFPSKDV